jgi:hypothetical protein
MLATKTGIETLRGTPNPYLEIRCPVIPPVDENAGRLLSHDTTSGNMPLQGIGFRDV